jgi:dihydropyrimidinase
MTPPADLRLSGGTVVLPGGVQPADVLIRDGVIVGVIAPGADAPASETLDVSGRHVLPGVVDAHVHLGDDITLPRTPEEVRPETAAAAAGGVTTLVAYLMSAEPYDDILPVARGAMEGDAAVDFGFHFCISTREQLEAIPHYIADLGVSSFKFFMNFRTDEGQRLGLPGNDDGFLFELLQAVAAHGGVVNPHAENADLIKLNSRRNVIDGPGAPLELWDRRAPGWVEAEALQRIAFWARHAGAELHAVHVTNAASLEVLRAARAHHPGISIETCPHYLTLDTTSDLGPVGKVNPPLRPPADREALWEAIAAGEVDTIGSDHVPRHGRFKEGGLAKASPGFPGMQQLLALVLTEGHLRRGIPLQRIVDLVATRPARTFGLGDRKGALRPGADADLVIVDLTRGATISADTEFASAGFTPWEGVDTGVTIERTLLRGETVYFAGEVAEEARGAFLHRGHSRVLDPKGDRS